MGWFRDFTDKVGDAVDQIYNPYRTVERVRDIWNDATSSSSYSDYVSKANERTNGWYSTIAGAIPIASGFHSALLGRDRAIDYLDNTGYSWSDIPGYMSSLLTGGSSAGLSNSVATMTKIADGEHDLYKFYSGDPDPMNMTGAPMYR